MSESQSIRNWPGLVAACMALWIPQAQAQYFPPQPLPPLTMAAQAGPHTFTTHQKGVFNGHRMDYTAAVADTIIESPRGTPAARLFTISYVADGKVSDSRPVLFVFNGGPGGSSALLHLAGVGPKTLADLSPAGLANRDNKQVDNPLCLLDVADLVFIDPTDTGFSHTLPGVAAEQFQSIDGDSESLTVLIISWLNTHGRMSSPKYLFGESYGSMRAVALARDLARSTAAVNVDGVILGGEAITFDQGSRTPDIGRKAARLPMMASLAWKYGKIDNKNQTWDQAVQKAERFSRSQYLSALAMGYDLDELTRTQVISQLPQLIGIPESYFHDNNTLVVPDFRTQLLKDRGLVIDLGNGLYTREASKQEPADTSGYEGVAAIASRYFEKTLRTRNLGDYEFLTPNIDRVFNSWNFRTTGAMALDATLADAMKKNSKLRVMVAQGRYDTLTDIGTTHYTIAQTDIPRERYTIGYFDGGHSLVMTPEIASVFRGFIRP